MIALILKDIATLKKTLLLTLAISIGLSILGIAKNEIFMIPLICAMIPLILTAVAFGYDTKANFEQFAFSMPIEKSSYVLSKLFFAFIFGLFGSICLFFLLLNQHHLSFDKAILISLFTLVVSVLISAIQLPFILKYGAEKGRLIIVIAYFVIFALSSYLKDDSSVFSTLTELLSKYSIPMILLGIIFLGFVLIAIAIKISIVIMQKKEY